MDGAARERDRRPNRGGAHRPVHLRHRTSGPSPVVNPFLCGLPGSSRFHSFDFDLDGIVPIFYSMFAVALGVALGAWRRRTLIAVGATLVIFAIFRGAVPTYVRPYYMKPMTLTYTGDPKQISTPAFIAAQRPDNWLVATHGQDVIVYQPGSRYWEFQGIEAAIYLGLTSLAVGTPYRIVLKRDA